ncbi:phosphatidylserine decarboxylase family protein [Tepidibacillus infernus]|uniref:phosphatidylserine decarboxylase family protein n=1 Tax=Tepidibacillus infernus TaxID=1806172 RepID=UPI003B6F7780
MKHHALIKEGLPTLGILLILTGVLYEIQPWLSLIGIGLILFVLYFFRDPKRESPINDELAIMAPADGVITDIREIEETSFMKQRAICISIFMSPLDVHINRSPISGEVKFIEYKKGKFIPATRPESHVVNEKNFIGIENEKMKVLVVQIAGIMARRIVNWSKLGQKIKKGDKIGMIKFSSGTQLYLPVKTEIVVEKGDKVYSGKTMIGRYLE